MKFIITHCSTVEFRAKYLIIFLKRVGISKEFLKELHALVGDFKDEVSILLKMRDHGFSRVEIERDSLRKTKTKLNNINY